jgi:hypothetical protein
MLLRSALVSDWPNLKIEGYLDATGATPPLTPVRRDRLAATLLLVLFNGSVQRVNVSEPAQHLHFGVGSASTPLTPLRYVDGAQAGTQLNNQQCRVKMRPDPARTVIDVEALAGAVAAGLSVPAVSIGAAALAVQLLLGPQSQAFRAGGTASPAPATLADVPSFAEPGRATLSRRPLR